MLSRRTQSTDAPGGPADANSESNAAGGPGRLLLVDDHVETARGMAKLFASAGYTVRTAFDGESALEAVGRENFDVLISDLGLTGMDGHDLMRKVRQRCSSIGIAISGHGLPDDIEKSHDAGFVEHFVKPVDFTEVLEAVARAVATRRRGS